MLARKRGDNTLIIIIIVLAVIIVGGGGLAFFMLSAEMPGLEQELGGIQPVAGAEASEDDYFFYNQALADSDPVSCSAITDSYLKDECITLIAVGTGDANICFSASDESSSWMCLRDTLRESSGCGGLPEGNLRDFCYSGFAVQMLSTDMCEMVSDAMARDECYMDIAIYSGNVYMCDSLTFMGDECRKGVAISLGDAAFCDAIKDSGKRDECKEAVVSQLAVTDPSVCQIIDDQEEREECLKAIGMI